MSVLTIYSINLIRSVRLNSILCMMLIFTPFFGCLSNSIAHIWLDLDCSWKRLWSLMGPGWYNRIVFPNLIPASGSYHTLRLIICSYRGFRLWIRHRTCNNRGIRLRLPRPTVDVEEFVFRWWPAPVMRHFDPAIMGRPINIEGNSQIPISKETSVILNSIYCAMGKEKGYCSSRPSWS